MASHHQSGQVVIETLVTFIFFAGLFLGLQALIERHKNTTNHYKLTREVKYEVQTTNKK